MDTETIAQPITPERLAEIEGRENATTPGPWGWRGQDNGSVELRALHGMGPRIITTMTAPPCIDYVNGMYFLRDAESLPSSDGPCETCTNAYKDGSFLKDPVHCERTDTWDTVHVWNRDGFCEPINRRTVRKQPYRADVAGTTHPDALFIEHARRDIPDLLAEVKRLRAAIRRVETMPLRHDAVGMTWFVTNSDLTRALYADDPALAEEAVTAALPGLLGALGDRMRAIPARDDETGQVAS